MKIDGVYKLFVSEASKIKRKLEEREEAVEISEKDLESKLILLKEAQDELKINESKLEKTKAIVRAKQSKLEKREETLRERLQKAQQLFN